MRWIGFLLFFIFDFMIISYVTVPTSSGKTGETWLPSELLDVGRDLDYETNMYSRKYGLTTSDYRYNIKAESLNNVLVNGKTSSTGEIISGGSSKASAEITDENSSYKFIMPGRGGSGGMIVGDEDFKVNKNSILATGYWDPSTVWNLYVYHPSLYSFIDNNLAMGNKWLYLSPDGYAYQVNVLGKDKDTYIIDIEYPDFKKDRLWINTLYPTPIRVERYDENGAVLLSSAMKG